MNSVHLTGALPVQEKHNFLTAVRNEELKGSQNEGRVIKTERMNYVSFKVILTSDTDELGNSHDWYNNYE